MFNFGWQRRYKNGLSGLSFVEAVGYLDIRFDKKEVDIHLLGEIYSKVSSSFDCEKINESAIEEIKSSNYPDDLVQVAFDRLFYKNYLMGMPGIGVSSAAILIEKDRFANYFFDTEFKKSGFNFLFLMFYLFPNTNYGPGGFNDSFHMRPLDREKRDLLLDHFLRLAGSEKKLKEIFKRFIDQHSFFYLYPGLLI